MGNEINIALLQMLPGKDITENMENSEIKSQVIFLNTCNPNVKASLASWHISKKVTVVSDSLRPHGLYSL